MRTRTFARLALILLLLVLLVECLPKWRSALMWSNAHARVQVGMTPQQVDKAIGLPPGYYEGSYPEPDGSRFALSPPLRQPGLPYEQCPNYTEVWVGRDRAIWVRYNDKNVVVGCYLVELTPDRHRQFTTVMLSHALLAECGVQ